MHKNIEVNKYIVHTELIYKLYNIKVIFSK